MSAPASTKKSSHAQHLKRVLYQRRKPLSVSVRIVDRNPQTGEIRTERLQGRRDRELVGRIDREVRSLFREGKDRLEEQEWLELLSQSPADPDLRWRLLVKLAVEKTDQTETRNAFVSLLDGLAFSMRLLLLDQSGGDRSRRTADGESIQDTLPFARLPDCVRMKALGKVLQQEAQTGDYLYDAQVANELHSELKLLGLSVQVSQEDVSGLRKKLKNNQSGDLFPNRSHRKGTSQKPTPVTTKITA